MLFYWECGRKSNVNLGWEFYANKATGWGICPVAKFYIYVICDRALRKHSEGARGIKGASPFAPFLRHSLRRIKEWH